MINRALICCCGCWYSQRLPVLHAFCRIFFFASALEIWDEERRIFEGNFKCMWDSNRTQKNPPCLHHSFNSFFVFLFIRRNRSGRKKITSHTFSSYLLFASCLPKNKFQIFFGFRLFLGLLKIVNLSFICY